MMRQTSRRSADHEALEGRLAVRLAAALGERAAEVPHDISERLRVARQLALVRARAARAAAPQVAQATYVSSHGAHGAATMLGGPTPWWLRLATWVPLVVLIGGLVAIEEWTAREQVLAAAEIDSVLLTDELPPDAWADAGFREFLKAPPR